MASYTISVCTVADSDALARNNISAWWEDENWTVAWRHRTREYHISQVALRTPRTLLNNRETMRHQKAVDPRTNRLVGCARWYVPPSHATDAAGMPVWPEAIVPAVTPEEETEIRRIAATAIWDPNTESDVLFEPTSKAKEAILAKKPYMRLEYLAVHPEMQGKGVGTALVRSGMREAEKLGLDVFIFAMKAGVGLYRRLGFRMVQEFIQDDSKYGGSGEHYVCFMIYDQERPSTQDDAPDVDDEGRNQSDA